MLRLFTFISFLAAAAAGVADVLLTTKPEARVDCTPHTIICASGTAYYWAAALVVALSMFVLLLWVGCPIIIAGRIGKRRNRRGYLAGIFFGWLGLLYIILREPRVGPDLIARAVTDYRGGTHPA